MQPRTEELLYFLLWMAGTLARPTWRNMNDSFEEWAWRNRLSRRLAELERQKLIERHPDGDLERVVRLTEEGRRVALGGRDPRRQWSRPWDGEWRMVLFDLPLERGDLRRNLLRFLHRKHFGYLQGSVWVSPDPTSTVRERLGDAKVQPDVFLIMEGRPAAGESDREIVDSAWNFAEINRRYQYYLGTVGTPPRDRERLPEWTRREGALWKHATGVDPMLPEALLPAGYQGREAWRARVALLGKLRDIVSS